MNKISTKIMDFFMNFSIPLSIIITTIIYLLFPDDYNKKILSDNFLTSMMGISSSLISVILTIIPLLLLIRDRKNNGYIMELLKNRNFSKTYDIYVNVVIKLSLILLLSILFYICNFSAILNLVLSLFYIFLLISIILEFSVTLFLFKRAVKIITNANTDNNEFS